MIVAVNTTPLHSAHGARGIGRYTTCLLDALGRYQKAHTFIPFTTKVPAQADIVHYPFFDLFFLTLPVRKTKPTVVTVHDLIPLVFPDKFPPGLKGSVKWSIQKYSLAGAARIITDSQNSKKDIVHFTKFASQQVDVVPLAPFVADNKNKAVRVLKPEYILYVGDVNWNKNVTTLIESFARVHDRMKSHLLVLVGKAFTNHDVPETKQIIETIDRLHLHDSVVIKGGVTDEELVSLYTNAAVLAVPSLYEGFGFPVLEAMKLGCPVVCGDNSSLGEIAGPSLIVDVHDSGLLAQGIETVLSYPTSKRNEVIEKGKAWAKRFTWERVAKETVASYTKTLHLP